MCSSLVIDLGALSASPKELYDTDTSASTDGIPPATSVATATSGTEAAVEKDTPVPPAKTVDYLSIPWLPRVVLLAEGHYCALGSNFTLYPTSPPADKDSLVCHGFTFECWVRATMPMQANSGGGKAGRGGDRFALRLPPDPKTSIVAKLYKSNFSILVLERELLSPIGPTDSDEIAKLYSYSALDSPKEGREVQLFPLVCVVDGCLTLYAPEEETKEKRGNYANETASASPSPEQVSVSDENREARMVPVNEWVHIAVVVGLEEMKLYKNSELVTSLPVKSWANDVLVGERTRWLLGPTQMHHYHFDQQAQRTAELQRYLDASNASSTPRKTKASHASSKNDKWSQRGKAPPVFHGLTSELELTEARLWLGKRSPTDLREYQDVIIPPAKSCDWSSLRLSWLPLWSGGRASSSVTGWATPLPGSLFLDLWLRRPLFSRIGSSAADKESRWICSLPRPLVERALWGQSDRPYPSTDLFAANGAKVTHVADVIAERPEMQALSRLRNVPGLPREVLELSELLNQTEVRLRYGVGAGEGKRAGWGRNSIYFDEAM